MGIFYPVRIQKNDPNKGRAPFDDKGNDNSVPVPGHPDWAKNKKNKGVKTAFVRGYGKNNNSHLKG
tara:strand:+ start:51 stop:248 length:198 start_codon:yes stop_codon:yes gene_type:complete